MALCRVETPGVLDTRWWPEWRAPRAPMIRFRFEPYVNFSPRAGPEG